MSAGVANNPKCRAVKASQRSTRTKEKTPIASSEAAAKRMRGIRQKHTNIEKLLRSGLHRAGLRFHIHRRVVQECRSIVDVVFPSAKVAVFVDSCFWHGCPIHGTSPKVNQEWWQAKLRANRDRDRRTCRSLRAAGWSVIRVWEHENFDKAVESIRSVVEQRRRLFTR